MAEIRWSKLDDYQFVKLVGELLGRLGFVDVDYQGDGPDGGIDLFATELVPFTIQGRTPFRWAIQCKFSAVGQDGSVNDREVRDVEGILRSERYAGQDARGYMLVTNRRIVQNVIERLRGVDRRSQFRTARVDQAHLESLLVDQPEVMQRYFGDRDSSEGLGRPALIATPVAAGRSGRSVASLSVELRVAEGAQGVRAVRTRGFIDTGADVTCVPRKLILEIGARFEEMINVSGPQGTRTEQFARLDMVLERILLRAVRVLAVDIDQVLLGRDVLHGFTVVIEPSGTVVLYEPQGDGQ